MKRQLILLTLLLLTNTFYSAAQNYAVNEIVPDITTDTFLQTKPVAGPRVVFIEKNFSIKVSKDDLVNALKAAAPEWGQEDENMFRMAIDYLSATDGLTFKYIWTKGEAIDNLTWPQAEQAGAKTLTQKLIKETMCRLLEQGNFELFSGDKQEKEYATGLVNTKMGKHAKGIFTTTKRLVWICPPWVTCALTRF